MRPSKTNIEILEIHKNSKLFSRAKLFLGKEVGDLEALEEEFLHNTEGFTLLKAPVTLSKTRKAARLLECEQVMFEHLAGQSCSHHGSPIEISRFCETSRAGVRLITSEEQFHLFEHLLLGELEKIKKSGGEQLDARTFQWNDLGHSVMMINARFEKARVRRLVDTTWHWLGVAIRSGKYPTVTELAAIMEVEYELLIDPGYASRMLGLGQPKPKKPLR